MILLGYPLEIWIAAGIAVFVRIQSSNRLTWLGSITTVSVGVFSGLILYEPLAMLIGLSTTWHVLLAIIIALSSENLMKAIVELSADREWIKDRIRYLVDSRDHKDEHREQLDESSMHNETEKHHDSKGKDGPHV